MAFELTNQDLLVLNEQRLERFRSLFDNSLPFCLLQLTPDNELTIHCPEPWLVDLLLYEIESICESAWIVVGAAQVAIYYAQEEIYTTATQAFSGCAGPCCNFQVPH